MRDYRQILFGPPELDSYLADNTKANLKEIEFFPINFIRSGEDIKPTLEKIAKLKGN